MTSFPAAALWCAIVTLLVLHAHPALVDGGPRVPPFARPPHPVPHVPVHGPGFDARAPISGATFQYRGDPQHRGVAAVALDTAELALRFEHRDENVGIHDASKSSPAVDASGIYVGFDTGRIVAFDHLGNRRWEFDVAQAARGVHATAALDDERLYLGAYNGTLYALDKRTGAAIWVLRLGDTIGSSATLVGDALYVSVETFAPPDGFVAKVDRATGNILWQSEWLGEQAHSTPTVDLASGLVFVGANNGSLRALAIDSGHARWLLACDGAIKGTLALAGGVLAFGTMGGTLYAVDAASGEPRWRRALGGKTRSSATIVPDLDLVVIGADDGRLSAFERTTGAPRWSLATDQRPYPASATAIRDPRRGWLVVAPCGRASICTVSAATGEALRRFDLDADLTNTPTIWNDSIYVSSDRHGGLARLGPR